MSERNENGATKLCKNKLSKIERTAKLNETTALHESPRQRTPSNAFQKPMSGLVEVLTLCTCSASEASFLASSKKVAKNLVSPT